MDGYITIGTEINTKEFDSQIKYIESKMLDIEDKLKQADMGFEVGDTEKLEAQYERLGNQLIDLKAKQEKYNQSIKDANMAGFDKMKESIDSVGNSVEKVTKKVTRWALAIFGIRSAYLFIRQSMSTLSQYDDQMATNVEWIRYLLANALKPVIEEIINLVYKLLVYINYIAQAWFGVNLFASASLKAFQKQQKAMSGSAKKAKELQKTIAGFDEMNVLQDNKDTSTGSGGGASLPSFPSMEDVDIPAWVKWIADNGDLLAGILLGIASAIGAIKLGAEGMMALGIGAIVAGIVFLVQDIVDFLKDPTWEGFVNILGDIAIIIGGIMLLMGNWWGLLIIIIGALVKLVAENWDTIAGILGAIGGWIYKNIIKPVGDFFVGLWKGIVNGVNNAIKTVKNAFSSVISFFKNIINTIVNLFKKIGTKVGDVIGSAFKGVINGVLKAIETILNAPIKAINGLIKIINKVPGISLGKLSTFNLPRLAKGGVINNPGKGVYTGSAIAGEAGREFYMPLQDEQMLSLVGEAIGRYVNINLTNITQLDGRQIARKVEQISNNNRFVLNR